MKTRLQLLAALALAAPALAQSEVLYRIDRPASPLHGWGNKLVPIADLDGDGVGELLVGVFDHATTVVGTVHSGATGAHLYDLTAPYEPLFYGAAYACLSDMNGDGVPELVAVGTRSGDWNSFEGRIQVYSGADGAVLHSFVPPGGVNLRGHAEALALGDVDGDGVEDLLCATSVSALGGSSLTVFSTSTGLPLVQASPGASNATFFNELATLSDHDGDGIADVGVTVTVGNVRTFQVRSFATGALLAELPAKAASFLTNNHEPFLGVADLDGDGLRDLASGGVFTPFVGLTSSSSGAALGRWDCAAVGETCVGSRLIEVADVGGDGHPDLLALESGAFGVGGLVLAALDPVDGARLFEERMLPLAGGYSGADRFAALPGVDPLGFPSFALFEDELDQVSVRRIPPALGRTGCASTPNSSGAAATIHARGSASLADAALWLDLDGAPAGESTYVLHGRDLVQLPLGAGFLCVGGGVGRIAAGQTDAAGHLSLQVDLAGLGVGAPGSRSFQAIFRDSTANGLQTSDAVTLALVP